MVDRVDERGFIVSGEEADMAELYRTGDVTSQGLVPQGSAQQDPRTQPLTTGMGEMS